MLQSLAFPSTELGLLLQDTGAFHKKPETKSAQDQLMNNPDMMTDMMKKNLGGIIPQVFCFLGQTSCPKIGKCLPVLRRHLVTTNFVVSCR